jgi:hypothetical protein
MSHETSGACPCRPMIGKRQQPWRSGIRDVRDAFVNPRVRLDPSSEQERTRQQDSEDPSESMESHTRPLKGRISTGPRIPKSL